MIRKYLQWLRHRCKIASRIRKSGISDFKAIFHQPSTPPKSMSFFNLWNFMQAFNLALTSRQEMVHMQHPQLNNKKIFFKHKRFLFLFYFKSDPLQKFIWKKGWIVYFVCFILKLPVLKEMVSLELRWGQAGC